MRSVLVPLTFHPFRLAVGCLVLFALAFPAPAQAALTTASEVKAAFLYNFARFVEWPPEDAEAGAKYFVIGLMGAHPFGPDIRAALEERKIGSRRIVVREIRTAQQGATCHLLFIAASEEGTLGATLKFLTGRPVLLVSDLPGFLAAGGMIEFLMEAQTVRFSINRTSVDAAGLKMSSQLLRFARSIEEFPAGGR